MIVQRVTHKVKPGCSDEVVKAFKTWLDGEGDRIVGHIYTSNYAWDTVVVDLHFETDQDRDKFWAGVDWGQPEAIALAKALEELTVSGTTSEVWVLQ
jgi:hypothetical protein